MADLGKRALSKAAEVGLEAQLDAADNLEVDLQTDPIALMNGHIEGATITGHNLVMQNALQTEDIKVEIEEIKVNPLKAALGEIELEHATDASVRIILSEADIDLAFNSQFMHEQIPSIELSLQGRQVAVTAQHISFKLPGEGKIAIHADLAEVEGEQVHEMAFTAVPKIAANGYRVEMTAVESADGAEVSPELTAEILRKIEELLDLRNFEVPSMNLQLSELSVMPGRLGLVAEARIQGFPGNIE